MYKICIYLICVYRHHLYVIQYSVQGDDVKYIPTMGYHKKGLESSALNPLNPSAGQAAGKSYSNCTAVPIAEGSEARRKGSGIKE